MVIVMKALTLTLAVVGMLAARSASAVTVQQVVALSKAGVSEAVIVALIERDKTILTIEPEELVALKADGVSDTIVLAMLKSGRAEAAAAEQADEEMQRAAYLAAASAPPEFVVIGHDPDYPNVGRHDRDRLLQQQPFGYGSDFNPVPYAVPYPVPYPVGVPQRNQSRRPVGPVAPLATRTPCFAQVTAGYKVPSIGFVTTCPPR
jgi:hypothetical protein